MKRIVGIAVIFSFSLMAGNSDGKMLLKNLKDESPLVAKKESNSAMELDQLYLATGLNNFLNKDILEKALTGFRKINPKKQILAIIDFNKPSNEKRLFIIDVASKQLLFHTLVAHGKNSGEEYATQFSNIEGSLKSSLGFYLTGQTIISPKHGYAMILNGLEKGINSNAKDREIIVHSADYVSDSFIAHNGMLGRSWGCPALPKELNKQIIDVLKDGAVLFIAGNSPSYDHKSTFLQ
ncbi:murein L,D-transpeptidase catalytic domain family protein [Solitalea sp. MAHUQ-68]|uniref:Murein L,D-transpeptidase catalytic domain family protein n=1 Tax=Solitalea agri TaxID=2953739 RepID=A0A9X2JCU9_9SPHI|nr:murein L,D-transpeptidase catalytic domain family protein [Solitalea agri]MCO4292929.1 murein L,D-transpeptidase catalytic domain family protein [Solitalea agri]